MLSKTCKLLSLVTESDRLLFFRAILRKSKLDTVFWFGKRCCAVVKGSFDGMASGFVLFPKISLNDDKTFKLDVGCVLRPPTSGF